MYVYECWYSSKNTFTDELMSKASQILKIPGIYYIAETEELKCN